MKQSRRRIPGKVWRCFCDVCRCGQAVEERGEVCADCQIGLCPRIQRSCD